MCTNFMCTCSFSQIWYFMPFSLYTCVYMQACVCVHVHVCLHVYACLHVCVHIYIWVCMCVHVWTCTCVYECVYRLAPRLWNSWKCPSKSWLSTNRCMFLLPYVYIHVRICTYVLSLEKSLLNIAHMYMYAS